MEGTVSLEVLLESLGLGQLTPPTGARHWHTIHGVQVYVLIQALMLHLAKDTETHTSHLIIPKSHIKSYSLPWSWIQIIKKIKSRTETLDLRSMIGLLEGPVVPGIIHTALTTTVYFSWENLQLSFGS